MLEAIVLAMSGVRGVHVRPDWRDKLHIVPERRSRQLTRPFRRDRDQIELIERSEEKGLLAAAVRKDATEDRQPLVLLHAPSGIGKSAFFQTLEREINERKLLLGTDAEKVDVAVAITFNSSTPPVEVESGLTVENTIVLRIAERLLCEDDAAGESSFEAFVRVWCNLPALKALTLKEFMKDALARVEGCRRDRLRLG